MDTSEDNGSIYDDDEEEEDEEEVEEDVDAGTLVGSCIDDEIGVADDCSGSSREEHEGSEGNGAVDDECKWASSVGEEDDVV